MGTEVFIHEQFTDARRLFERLHGQTSFVLHELRHVSALTHDLIVLRGYAHRSCPHYHPVVSTHDT